MSEQTHSTLSDIAIASVPGSVETLAESSWHQTAVTQESNRPQGTLAVKRAFRPARATRTLYDSARVETERQAFLKAARLQQRLSTRNSPHWVRVLDMSDAPDATFLTVEKCAGSVQHLIDHRAAIDAPKLFAIAASIIAGLLELQSVEHRAHNNLKGSNVLEIKDAAASRFVLCDPSARDEKHSENDLLELGIIIYELVNGKSPENLRGKVSLVQSPRWAALGPKGAKWFALCERLLDFAGCHDPLEDVQRQILALRPSAFHIPWRPLAWSAAALILVASTTAAAIRYGPSLSPSRPHVAPDHGPVADPTPQPKPTIPPPAPPPADDLIAFQSAQSTYLRAKADWDTAKTDWDTGFNSPNFDNYAAGSLAAAAIALAPAGATSTAPADLAAATVAFQNATKALQPAIQKERDARRLFDLAMAYQTGRGQQIDLAAGKDNLEKAADADSTAAMIQLEPVMNSPPSSAQRVPA